MFFMKKKPQKKRRVSISIGSIDSSFEDGKKSKTLTLHDAKPEEVFKLVMDALKPHLTEEN